MANADEEHRARRTKGTERSGTSSTAHGRWTRVSDTGRGPSGARPLRATKDEDVSIGFNPQYISRSLHIAKRRKYLVLRPGYFLDRTFGRRRRGQPQPSRSAILKRPSLDPPCPRGRGVPPVQAGKRHGIFAAEIHRTGPVGSGWTNGNEERSSDLFLPATSDGGVSQTEWTGSVSIHS